MNFHEHVGFGERMSKTFLPVGEIQTRRPDHLREVAFERYEDAGVVRLELQPVVAPLHAEVEVEREMHVAFCDRHHVVEQDVDLHLHRVPVGDGTHFVAVPVEGEGFSRIV